MMTPAPVAVFAYNRSQHLMNLLLSLEANPLASVSDVTIFLDGPKNDHDENEQVAIRNFLNNEFSFRSMSLISTEKNQGLASSIRAGVSHILDTNNTVIVLEDDLVLAPNFLNFMNEGLERYAQEYEVASIHGFQYPLKTKLTEPVFFRGADCWGWATWSDRWASVSFEPDFLMKAIMERGLVKEFDLDGKMDFFQMLQDQLEGKIDSWAICWHASMFLQNRLTLFPPVSLVQNLGNDGSGVHSGVTQAFETRFAHENSWSFPAHPVESILFRNELGNFYQNAKGRRNVFQRVFKRFLDNLGISFA